MILYAMMMDAMILNEMILDGMMLERLHNSSSQDLRSTIVIALSLRGYSIVGNGKGASGIKVSPPPGGSR